MMVYDRMRLNKKARDLSLPQPQEAVYFGTAKEDIGKYCATLKKRHPEVEKPTLEDLVSVMFVCGDRKSVV